MRRPGAACNEELGVEGLDVGRVARPHVIAVVERAGGSRTPTVEKEVIDSRPREFRQNGEVVGPGEPTGHPDGHVEPRARWRARARARSRRERAPSPRGLPQERGEAPHGRVLEELDEGHGRSEALLQPGLGLHEEQRVSPELEEALVHSHLGELQQVLPDRRDLPLHLRDGSGPLPLPKGR
jgi:hypothetical protein